jgi:hypothetical protein
MKFASANYFDRNSGERSGGTCFLPIRQQFLRATATLPFVIPTAAEGSAVRHYPKRRPHE